MTHMISPHWIPQHRGPEDRETFARWQPWAVKVLTNDERIPYLEDIPVASQIVVRHYPSSDQLERAEQAPFGRRWFRDEQDAAQTGIRIAGVMKRIADWCVSRGVDRDRLLFEGPLNEPNLWAGEPPALYATCCRWFLEQMHVYGLHSVVGLFGVGWPGNDGPDTPVNWDFFRPVAALMRPGDYIGVHEYWSLNGPQELWRWWAGRFLQCPYMVPILVTECGVDTGVANIRPAIGWHGLPGSFEEKAARYVGELRWYAEQCKADGRVKAIFPFTHDYASNEWNKFDTRNAPFLNALFAQPVIEPPTGGGTYPPEPVDVVAAALRAEFGARFADLRASLPKHATAKYARRELSAITHIVVHHTATVAADTTWEAVARYHVNSKGYAGIAYHIGIGPDGSVSYLGDLDTHRHHASSANAYGVGVCLLGNFETETPTAAALLALAGVDRVLPAVLGRALKTIGHRDVPASGTVCPGANLYAALYPSTAPNIEEQLRARTWNEAGIRYNKDAAFAIYARQHGLGMPVTNEFELAGYVAQGYADAILYARVGEWHAIKQVSW